MLLQISLCVSLVCGLPTAYYAQEGVAAPEMQGDGGG